MNQNETQQRSNALQQRSNALQQESNVYVQDKVDEILTVLKGSYEQEGLVTLVKKIHETLHAKDDGILIRVATLERASERQNGIVVGICAVGTLIGVFVGWCIEWFRGGK